MFELGPTLTTAIIASIGSVGLWTFLGKVYERLARRKESEEDRLRRELSEEKTSHAECLERLDDVERRLEVVEHHHVSLVPRWIKDASKRVIWVNDAAMMQIFAPLQISREQVEGHTFQDLLDPDAAREIDRLDRAALARPGLAATTLLTLHPSLKKMHVAKVAGVGRDRELIYEGYAYCANDPAEVLDRGARRQQEQRGLSALRRGAAGADEGDQAVGD